MYDGNRTAAATLAINTAGLVDGEIVSATGLATFNSKDVRDANLVTVNSTTLVDDENGSGLASNYSLQAGQTAAASITPKALSASLAAQTKTYDGNNTASWTSGVITASGFASGEGANVTKTSGTYNSKNVLEAISVNATLAETDFNFTGGGVASNYTLPTSVTASGTINKAALTYTASKASSNTGNTPTGLGGAVSGFVNNESQSSATTGTLAWTTPANSASGAGSYAINGSGLSADNYSFRQAVESSTALTLIQSVSIVPVINSPSLSSGTGFGKSAQLSQTSAPLSVPDNINTLSATSAGSVQSNGPTITKSFGSSGLLYTQGSGVKLPSDFFNVTPADPAKNP